VPDMADIKGLSKPTRLEQQQVILKLFGYRLCDAAAKSELNSTRKFLAPSLMESLDSQGHSFERQRVGSGRNDQQVAAFRQIAQLVEIRPRFCVHNNVLEIPRHAYRFVKTNNFEGQGSATPGPTQRALIRIAIDQDCASAIG